MEYALNWCYRRALTFQILTRWSSPRRDEHLAFWVKTEVCDAMLEVVKACLGLRFSLCVDLDVTLLADSDGDLVAFKGQGQAPRGAPVANSASTFSEILQYL